MPLAALTTKLKRLEVGERFVRRNPLYYSRVQREFAALENAGAAVRQDWVAQRLSRILHAASHTDYGRSVDAPRQIGDWPLLLKDRVRDQPNAFVRPTWSKSLFNARAATGGTTGVPLRLQRCPESVVAEQVCQDDAVAKLGADPRTGRIAVLRGDDIKDPSDVHPPFWIHAVGGKRLLLSSNHLAAASLEYFAQALREFSADLLWVYPTTLEALCLLLQRAGMQLQVPRVMSSSEMLQPDVWTLARETLGCALVDRYGQAERVACAHAFAPDSYRFIPGYAHVELLPDSEDESAKYFEIVGTSLWNTAMPLVRYRTGDLVRVPRHYGSRELQEIVDGLRPFDGVIGRINDVLLDVDGQRVLAGINQIPRGVEHLVRLQVFQSVPHEVVLRVLAAPGFGEAQSEHLVRNARLKIPASIAVRVEIADDLQRTERGKTPFVIHGAPVQQGLRRLSLPTAA